MKTRCARCGKRLKKGGPSYRLKAELISHFDGYLMYNNKNDLAEKIETFKEEMKDMSEEEITKQVYEKFEYIVCPSCRDELALYLNAGNKE